VRVCHHHRRICIA
jgi:hypothetical protein